MDGRMGQDPRGSALLGGVPVRWRRWAASLLLLGAGAAVWVPATLAADQATPAAAAPYRYLPSRFAGRAGQYYRHLWGIDQLSVREAESGQILRFTWRVVDAERAAPLNDQKVEPTLIAPERGVSLVVPVLDKIGQLRQTVPPEPGRTYWMAFSNKGHLIRRGDRVNVVVGTFRAEGLVVD
jgi:hypothetical protein